MYPTLVENNMIQNSFRRSITERYSYALLPPCPTGIVLLLRGWGKTREEKASIPNNNRSRGSLCDRLSDLAYLYAGGMWIQPGATEPPYSLRGSERAPCRLSQRQ